MTRSGSRSPKGGAGRPSEWYHGGLCFECQACGRCCGGEPGYIWMTREEIDRAARSVGMHVLDFCEMYLVEYHEGFSLRELSNGDCCMLEGGKCRIYAVRPMQCRTWPFWPSNLATPEDWAEAGRRCPGINRGRKWTIEEIRRQRSKMEI